MTKEELKEKYGINVEHLTEDYGDANIIVQCFGKVDDDEEKTKIYPLVYMPRKETCYTNEDYDLSNEKDKQDYLRWLRDSQERLKILALLLHQQEEEIEQFGYPKSSCYYPDLDSIHGWKEAT